MFGGKTENRCLVKKPKTGVWRKNRKPVFGEKTENRCLVKKTENRCLVKNRKPVFGEKPKTGFWRKNRIIGFLVFGFLNNRFPVFKKTGFAHPYFKVKGMVKPLKMLLSQKFESYVTAFKKIGTSWTVDDTLIAPLEEFVCALYGSTKCSSVDELRLLTVNSEC